MELTGGPSLYDRQAELDVIRGLLDRATRREGTVTLVEGPAGIGKTCLLQEARTLARRNGLRVLSARCAPLERDFASGVVRQLFEPILGGLSEEELASVLVGPAAGAATMFGCPSEMGPDGEAWPPDAMMTNLHSLYWLTSNLAEREPLLLIIDDGQWADTASLHFLDFLVRRIDELPVALIMAMRWADADAGDTAGLLAAVASEPATRRLHLRPLGDAAVCSLIRAELDQIPEAPFVAACHKVTGGNPFLLGELVAELRERGVPPGAEQVDDVLRLGPPSIARALELRLARLPPEAGVLARGVAILGNAAEPFIAAEYCRLEPGAIGPAADALTRCGILCEDGSLTFRHSIQRAAVYAELARSDRAEGHRRAAEVLVRHHASPEQVAAHLLLCDPHANPAAVELLRRAAATSLARGSPDVAATYLRRALAEPPEPAVRSDVLIELCVAEARSPERSSFESLRLGLELLKDPHQRAEVAVEVARAIGLVADTAAALELLDRAIRDLGAGDDALRLRLEAEFISVARLYPASRESAIDRLSRHRSAAGSTDSTGSILLANLALERIEDCDLEPGLDLARRALTSGTLFAEERWIFAYAVNALMWADHTEEAERAWTEGFRQAERRGSLTMRHLAAIWRSHLAFRCGSVNDAEADARVGLTMCRERAWTYSRSYAVAFLVDALVERADLDAAERVVEENPSPTDLHYQLASVARLRCAQGRFAEGLDLFLRCGAHLAAQGSDRNPTIIPWRSGAAAAALQLGERQRARDLADEEVTHALAFGAPRALGIALRTRALVEEGSGQVERLEEAVTVLSRSPGRLEEARALADLGAALRRAGKRSEAEVRLRVALKLAHTCGGVAIRDRVRDELLRSGLRPRRFTSTGLDALTPSERRVADLAVAGLSNREIAQSLFVSLKTVEAHLGSVYRKLGVSARSQLVDLWASRSQPVGSPN